jgi:hypothetical protein
MCSIVSDEAAFCKVVVKLNVSVQVSVVPVLEVYVNDIDSFTTLFF